MALQELSLTPLVKIYVWTASKPSTSYQSILLTQHVWGNTGSYGSSTGSEWEWRGKIEQCSWPALSPTPTEPDLISYPCCLTSQPRSKVLAATPPSPPLLSWPEADWSDSWPGRDPCVPGTAEDRQAAFLSRFRRLPTEATTSLSENFTFPGYKSCGFLFHSLVFPFCFKFYCVAN